MKRLAYATGALFLVVAVLAVLVVVIAPAFIDTPAVRASCASKSRARSPRLPMK